MAASAKIRILIVDDHQVVIDGVKAMFEQHPTIEIVAEALTGKAAVEALQQQAIEVVLLDINLPDKNGIEVCKEIKGTHAATKVIALTMHSEAAYISKMAKAGVDGYILKNSGKAEIIQAVEHVMTGQQFFSQAVTQSLISAMHQPKKPTSSDFIQKLTRREKEVLRLIVEEQTTEEIAQTLFISSSTVISHRKSLLRKLNAKNSAGLVKAAYEFGLLD